MPRPATRQLRPAMQQAVAINQNPHQGHVQPYCSGNACVNGKVLPSSK
jgi:hypothetical protein